MSQPKVFVTRRIPEAGLRRLAPHCRLEVWPDELPPGYPTLTAHVVGCQGILSLLTDRIDGPLMDAAGSRLKVVSNMAVGYDNIDLAAARKRSIAVGNTPGVLTETTADLAFALLAASARRLVEGVDHIRTGKWLTWGPRVLLGYDLHGATLGIVGFGRIGQAMARRAAGFNMRVLFADPNERPEQATSLGAEQVSLDDLLAQADFVTLHAPANEATRHLIGRRELALMKSSAVLINTARGTLVDQAELVAALRGGRIAGAGLDVTEPEPLPADHELMGLPNCLVVPHIGSASHATRDRMAVMAADNLLAGLWGKELPHAVV